MRFGVGVKFPVPAPTASLLASSLVATRSRPLITGAAALSAYARLMQQMDGTTASPWPDATNTGVPAGVTLTNSGPVTLSTAGQSIDSLRISGPVTVTAKNCSITRCYIDGGNNAIAIDASATGTDGLVVTDCEIVSSNPPSYGIYGIECQNAQILRCNIHSVYHCLNTNGGNLVKDCYFHDLVGPAAGHYENIYNGGGTVGPDTYRHNTMYSFDTACIFLKTDYGACSNNIVDNNKLLQGTPQSGLHATSYTIYLDNTGSGMDSNQVTNNLMQIGYYGYSSVTSQTKLTWSGNVDWQTGATISPNQ